MKIELRIHTLGGFRAWLGEGEIPPSAWVREKALHLIQLLVTKRKKRLHKEQIIQLLWPELEPETGDRDFRVALNALQRTIEPDRPPRAPSKFIIRSELTYQLNREVIWIDIDEFESHIIAGNQVYQEMVLGSGTGANSEAIAQYAAAIALYEGDYLPERRYEDWTAGERERLRTLALGGMTQLAEMLVGTNPLESLRLTQRALALDPVWESAYRIEMQAYLVTGNRPMAIRTYQNCVRAIEDEFGLEPLPETRALYEKIRAI